MATKPVASIARLRAANNNAYDAQANPNGLAQGGHRQNWVPNAGAEVDVAQWVADLAVEVEADAQAIDATAVAIEQSRQQAVTKAGEAAESATAAANAAARMLGTSTTSRTPVIGSLTFTTQAGKAFDVGQWLMVQSRGTVGRWAFGKVTAYAGTSVTIAAEAIGPTVSAGTDWNLLVSGGRGAIGERPFTTPLAWAAGVTYTAGPPASAVVYNGETYVCILGHTSDPILPTNATYWIKIAKSGADGVTQDVSGKLDRAGGQMTGTLKVATVTNANNAGGANFANANTFLMSMSAAMTLSIAGLDIGQEGQVLLAYNGGALSISSSTGSLRFAVSEDAVSSSFADTTIGGVGLVSGAVYQAVFSRLGNGNVICRMARAF